MENKVNIKETFSVVNGELSSYDKCDFDENSFYEVFKLTKSGPVFLREHVDRLNASISKSTLSRVLSYDDIFLDLMKLIKANTCYPLNVRYTVNINGRGCIRKIKFIESTYPSEELREDGVVLKTKYFERDRPNQKIYTSEMRDLRKNLKKEDVFDYLLVDKNNKIRECSKSNIFFYKDGKVFTAGDETVLSGVTRKAVLSLIDANSLVYDNINVSDISKMDGAFITGTSIGVLSVRRIDDVVFDKADMMFVTSLNADYNKLVEEDLKTFTGRDEFIKMADLLSEEEAYDYKIFKREVDLIGRGAFTRLKNSSVLIVGLGGVGGSAAEAICRAGIGTIGLLDFDTVDYSNINRQIIALRSTVGRLKTDVMAERLKDINEEVVLNKHNMMLTEENVDCLKIYSYDYIIDAIDSVNSKIALIKYAVSNDITIISSMGTGGKLNVLDFKIDKIKNTKGCPLARVMRKRLLALGMPNVKVLYSEEKRKGDAKVPSSISFVPPACGMILAGEVVKDLMNS